MASSRHGHFLPFNSLKSCGYAPAVKSGQRNFSSKGKGEESAGEDASGEAESAVEQKVEEKGDEAVQEAKSVPVEAAVAAPSGKKPAAKARRPARR